MRDVTSSCAALLLVASSLAGCGSPVPADPPLLGDDILAAPPTGEGIQLEMVSSLEPAQEIERCQFFQVGADELDIAREEVRFSPGSHHVLLFSTPYTSIPTVDHAGHTRDTSRPVDCNDGAFADWDIDGVIGGAQTPTARSSTLTLPQGVALKLAAGSVVLMNTHYLNATNHTSKVTSRMNLWRSPAGSVSAEAGVLFFYDFYIRVPPLGTSSSRMRCPIRKDITLLDAQSHMHRRGVGYEATLTDAAGQSMMPLYRGKSWDDVTVASWPGGLPLPSGSWVDYRCDYRNDEARTVVQGFTTHDEMCMFIGLYYPRDAQLERCALDDSFWTSDLAAMHVGSGTATCAATRACLASASTSDGGAATTQCRLDLCPAAAQAYYAVDQCNLTNANHACDADCKQPGAACVDCLDAKCANQLKACDEAGC